MSFVGSIVPWGLVGLDWIFVACFPLFLKSKFIKLNTIYDKAYFQV